MTYIWTILLLMRFFKTLNDLDLDNFIISKIFDHNYYHWRVIYN